MNLKFSKKDIPEKYKTKNAKIKYLIKKIDAQYQLLKGHEKTYTEHAYKLGQMLVVLKKLSKKNNRKWTAFVNEKFPHMTVRTAQRYMKLAKKTNLGRNRSLAAAGLSRLVTLASLAKDDEVNDFLDDNEIFTKIDTDDKQAVRDFRKDIDKFIDSNKTKFPRRSAQTNTKLDRLMKTAEAVSVQIKSLKDDDDLSEVVDLKKIKRAKKLVKQVLKDLNRAVEIMEDDDEEDDENSKKKRKKRKVSKNRR